MTRKHKPQNTQKKRPVAQNIKPLKAPPADKAVAAVAGLRDKDRGKHTAVIARKAGVGARVGAASPKVNDSARAPDSKVAGSSKLNADKRPLGLERRVPVMPEDRQSQLKLLIARGKEQGYLT